MERKTREKRKRKKKRVEEISQDEREKIREGERRKIMKEMKREKHVSYSILHLRLFAPLLVRMIFSLITFIFSFPLYTIQMLYKISEHRARGKIQIIECSS